MGLQAPAVLLLDELTSFLDGGDQAAVLRAVRAAVDTTGVTAVWVGHRHTTRSFVQQHEPMLCWVALKLNAQPNSYHPKGDPACAQMMGSIWIQLPYLYPARS